MRRSRSQVLLSAISSRSSSGRCDALLREPRAAKTTADAKAMMDRISKYFYVSLVILRIAICSLTYKSYRT